AREVLDAAIEVGDVLVVEDLVELFHQLVYARHDLAGMIGEGFETGTVQRQARRLAIGRGQWRHVRTVVLQRDEGKAGDALRRQTGYRAACELEVLVQADAHNDKAWVLGINADGDDLAGADAAIAHHRLDIETA